MMGSVCCCIHVKDPEVVVDGSIQGNCICPNCVVHKLINKYSTFFRSGRQTCALPSSGQEAAASSIPNGAPENTQPDTVLSPPRPLVCDANSPDTNLQQHELVTRLVKGAGIILHIDSEQELTAGSDCGEGSKKCDSESSSDLSQENEKAEDLHDCASVEEEDVCPICLEEYTPENPKIPLHCSHEYHLGCLYDWMERSGTCPVCSQVMIFDETN